MSTKAILYHFQILSSSNIRVMCVTGRQVLFLLYFLLFYFDLSSLIASFSCFCAASLFILNKYSANRTRIMAGEDGTIFNAVQNGFYGNTYMSFCLLVFICSLLIYSYCIITNIYSGPAYNIEFINNTAFSYLDYERMSLTNSCLISINTQAISPRGIPPSILC